MNHDETTADRKWQQRSAILLKPSGLENLSRAHVLLAGAGGVGGYAAEALARAGIGHLSVYDPDVVQPSNRNRQLLALCSTENRPKVDVLRTRVLDINPDIRFDGHAEALTPENIPGILENGAFDYLLDAIDSLSDKCALLAAAYHRGLPTIAAMGAGGRVDPAQIRYADIAKTYNCRLARQVRGSLRKLGITKGIPCVFSPEDVPDDAVLPPDFEHGVMRSTVGTISYLPGVFGLFLAAAAIRELAGKIE